MRDREREKDKERAMILSALRRSNSMQEYLKDNFFIVVVVVNSSISRTTYRSLEMTECKSLIFVLSSDPFPNGIK